MPDLRHYDNLNTVRFITFSCHNRLNLLNDDNAKLIFLKHLDKVRSKYEFKLHCFVIMPNHIHLIVYPIPGTSIGQVIGELKSWSPREILDNFKLADAPVLDKLKVLRRSEERLVFWQKRCYDHNCRGMKSVKEKIRYCHRNPVTRGLVKNPQNWRWSSFNYYAGNEYNLLRIDTFDFENPTASGGAPRDSVSNNEDHDMKIPTAILQGIRAIGRRGTTCNLKNDVMKP